jgi:hypothetical protein
VNRKITTAAVALLAVLGLGTSASAGQKTTTNVVIWPGAFITVAYGSLGTARNSADNNQLIGCLSQGSSATCWATDSTGASVSCSTSVAADLAAIHSMNGDSYLLFAWENGTGTCEWVYVRNQSNYAPKLP